MKYYTLLILFCMPLSVVMGQAQFEGRLHAGELPYRVLVPLDFNENQKYPVVLFLHGAGERGSDNQKQLVHGSKLFLDSLHKYPAIVIFPQCPTEDYWASIQVERNEAGKRKFIYSDNPQPTKALQLVIDLVDSLLSEDFVDKERIYLTGLSMGGMGTFELLSHRPNIFAAAAPICGGANPELVDNYNKNTDFWVFHGAKDSVVPPVYSTNMVKALQERNFKVAYSLYPGVDHNSWDYAFKETNFLSWLFSKSLNDE